MVVFDQLFKTDFENLSDRELLDFRKEQIENLYNGQKDSPANVERESLIEIADKEIEFRFKKKTEVRSNWALLISVISLFISLCTIWK